ncbi:MAG: bifunctional nuclease family protein [Pelotomaculaceae bacterium]|jgi:bifunctional DNase/RNase|nr:bifunctional nuclease family protein [Bacillota bacterium]HHU86604.1 bifunctional nuclease family protein [Peptococcaceae bacterium]
MIPVKVKEIAYDVMMNPVVLLVDEAEVKALPIWVGPFEAHAIAFALQGIRLDRPLTHDLLKNICDRLEAKLSMIIINDVRDGTYFAEIHMWHSGRELVLDSRPSDAIALALRTETPIYMSEKVARDTLAIKDLLSEEQQQELKELLESNRPNETKKSLH